MKRLLAASLVTCLALAGCATPNPSAGETEVRYGTISKVETVKLDGDHQLGLGAIIGGIAGGVLGHQIGSGSGQAVATVAGALGGAYVGQRTQSKYGDGRPGHHIIVQLDNGVAVGITQPVDPNLRVGDKVRVEGTGPDARVVRR
jgi:outer membrane lipoprotein SlyB